MGLRDEFEKLDIEELKAIWMESNEAIDEIEERDEGMAFTEALSLMERNAEAYPVITELGRFIAGQIHLSGYSGEMSIGAIFGTHAVAYVLRAYEERQMLNDSLNPPEE